MAGLQNFNQLFGDCKPQALPTIIFVHDDVGQPASIAIVGGISNSNYLSVVFYADGTTIFYP